MKLFEASSGEMGCSYVRMYIWAIDLDQAKTFTELGGMIGSNIEIEELMDSRDKPFYTKRSDEGWER